MATEKDLERWAEEQTEREKNRALSGKREYIGSAEWRKCPFCGCAMCSERNRDWQLIGTHDDGCVFDRSEATLTVPAYDDCMEWMKKAWNRRTSIDWLADLLDKVDCEFGRLSELDCPEYVNPDNELWDEIVKRKNEMANDKNEDSERRTK